MANIMNPSVEGQKKDVLLVLDKQQGKVSALKVSTTRVIPIS